MSDQDALFGVEMVGVDRDHALARFTDPATSHAADAALRAREGSAIEIRKGTHRHRALACFLERDLIAEDVKVMTGIDGVWKRVSDLKSQKLIEATGYTRASREGREADVYRITEAGLATLERLR